ncbi:MAG: hypothetical protein GX678_07955, partial [Actinomycetales bacterium]|nr:hypothetical protein [Actinomycetales bacterium]
AERMGKLGTWVSPKEYESDAAKAERFADDLPIAGDNSFVRVTALYMSGRLSAEQYKTLKDSFGLRFNE